MEDLEKEIDLILGKCDKAFVETLPNSTDTYVSLDDVREKIIEFCKRLIEKKELLNINSKSDIFTKLNISDPELMKFIEDSFLNLEKVKLKEYPDSVFYFKDKKYHFEHNLKNNYTYINYNKIWLILEDKFKLDYQIIRDLTKDIIEQTYNLKVSATRTLNFDGFIDIERAYNLKDLEDIKKDWKMIIKEINE